MNWDNIFLCLTYVLLNYIFVELLWCINYLVALFLVLTLFLLKPFYLKYFWRLNYVVLKFFMTLCLVFLLKLFLRKYVSSSCIPTNDIHTHWNCERLQEKMLTLENKRVTIVTSTKKRSLICTMTYRCHTLLFTFQVVGTRIIS